MVFVENVTILAIATSMLMREVQMVYLLVSAVITIIVLGEHATLIPVLIHASVLLVHGLVVLKIMYATVILAIQQ